MIQETRKTLRNVLLLIVQRGFHILGAAVFALVVPRMMGPEIFGRYALITSLSLWFALASGMGAVSVMTRFVPEMILRQDRTGVRRLVSGMLALRLSNGVVAAALYLLLTTLWLQEIDWTALLAVAGSVLLRTGGNIFFTLFLGLNQAARWGMGEFLRRWVTIFTLLTGYYLGGLRGGCLGLLVTELVILIVGFWWGRFWIDWKEFKIDWGYLRPFVSYSSLFFVSNLLLTLSQRSGEALVKLFSGAYVEVGYYGAAYAIYQTIAHAMWQISVAFAPLFQMLLAEGRTEQLQLWVERLLKWIAIGGVLAVFGAMLPARSLIPWMLGAKFTQVYLNLIPLTVSLLTLALTNACRLLALTYDRPETALKAAIVQIAAFWGLGSMLVVEGGSLAGCSAVLIASALQAGYFVWKTRCLLAFSLRGWFSAVATGALFLPLVWLAESLLTQTLLYALFLLGYGVALLTFKVVTLTELTELRRATRF